MKRPTLAIIGTGVAGLGCAHFLHPHFDLTLFEQNDYAGGHTNTVNVLEGKRELPVDTGFMVFNHVTYPLLARLFKELEVETKPTSMSFSVSHLESGIEYNGTSLGHLFGQPAGGEPVDDLRDRLVGLRGVDRVVGRSVAQDRTVCSRS